LNGNRIISKRTAIQLCGEQVVTQYVDTKIDGAIGANDLSDWRFVGALDPSTSYDLANETAMVLRRFIGCRP
jgi:phosphopantothenoylcysteine synthetase/decarboxylase